MKLFKDILDISWLPSTISLPDEKWKKVIYHGDLSGSFRWLLYVLLSNINRTDSRSSKPSREEDFVTRYSGAQHTFVTGVQTPRNVLVLRSK